jgi:hypothetical protein
MHTVLAEAEGATSPIDLFRYLHPAVAALKKLTKAKCVQLTEEMGLLRN